MKLDELSTFFNHDFIMLIMFILLSTVTRVFETMYELNPNNEMYKLYDDIFINLFNSIMTIMIVDAFLKIPLLYQYKDYRIAIILIILVTLFYTPRSVKKSIVRELIENLFDKVKDKYNLKTADKEEIKQNDEPRINKLDKQ